MKIAYASVGADLKQIKALGFDTVCGPFMNEELNEMLSIGLGCIFAGGYVEHAAIVAYYLYDEPDLNKISLEDQEKRIAEFRALTQKPLAIACIEQAKQLCSKNYDWYMLDIYYLTEIGPLKKIINYLNAAFSTYMVRVLYKDKLLIPILGIFDDTGDFKWSKHYRDNFLPFAKKFKSYFRWTNSYAVFLYGNQNKYSDVYYANGFCYRNEYLCAVTDINNNDVPNCWWITSKFLTMAGYVCVLSRKYIITDKVIGWINKILPENMQIR